MPVLVPYIISCPMGPRGGCSHFQEDLQTLRDLTACAFSTMWTNGLKQLELKNCRHWPQETYLKYILSHLADEVSYERLLVLLAHMSEKEPRRGIVLTEVKRRHRDAGVAGIMMPGYSPAYVYNHECNNEFNGIKAVATGVVPLEEQLLALKHTQCKQIWRNGRQYCIVAGIAQNDPDIYWHLRGLKRWLHMKAFISTFTYIPPEHRRPNVDTDSE